MHNPQEEAIDILRQVLSGLFDGNADIKTLLRKCTHICQILSWSEQFDWFQCELNGYSSEIPLPWYRKEIKGRMEWLTAGGIYTTLDSVIEDGFRTKKEPTKITTLDVWAGIDWILSATQSGYVESTGKKSSKYISFRNKHVDTEQVRTFNKGVFQTILKEIENEVFNFASRAYSVLLYGDALQDVWQAYRTIVDAKLTEIGVGKHLDTVRAGLNSNNPQDWRAAMWSCRDILRDLASYLWQDSRETYVCLPGQGKDGKLEVTQSKYVNRLGAYIHQKGISGETGAYIRAEMERVYHSIKTLNELDSKAHDVVTLPIVRIAAIGTYVILGELSTHTDMNPVTQYTNL